MLKHILHSNAQQMHCMIARMSLCYAEAYYLQQCTANPLYDAGCEGHYDAQCEANALYDFLCPGYNDAYFDPQCQYNPQYDTQCPGYVEPIVETSPEDLIDDGAGTGDAIVDSIIEIPVTVINEMIIMPIAPQFEHFLTCCRDCRSRTRSYNRIIELEVEAQIEVELQEVVIDEPVVEEVIIETPVVEEIESEVPDETNTEEEIGGDVEQQWMEIIDHDEDNSEGTTEDTTTDEVSEGDTTKKKQKRKQ